MNKKQIRIFYKAFNQQILNEMQEYFDMPLQNIEKTGEMRYKVSENNVSAFYQFIRRFEGDMINLPDIIDQNQIENYYEIMWDWDSNIPLNERNSKNWLRITGTSFIVLNDFLKNNYKTKVIFFSGNTHGHSNIYLSERFIKRLKQMFGEQYLIYIDKKKELEETKIFIINKTVLTERKLKYSTEKRARYTSLYESLIYWYYPNLHPDTPPNVKIKAKIKYKVLENMYLNKEIKL